MNIFSRLIIEKLGMCALSMEEVHGIGIKEAVKYALSRIDPRNKRHIHVSFDIDALDPLEAPSTGTPGRMMLLKVKERNLSFILCSQRRINATRRNRIVEKCAPHRSTFSCRYSGSKSTDWLSGR